VSESAVRCPQIQPVVSAAVFDNKVVTGTATGHLYVWTDRTVSRTITAHERTVNALHSTGDLLVSGAKDGTVKVWGGGADVVLLSQYDLNTALPKPVNLSVRSVKLFGDRLRSTILVGTKSSDVYEVVRLTGKLTQLSTAHCVDEVWGLAPHPTNADVFVTAGDDKTVRLWSVSRKRQLAMVVQENSMRVSFCDGLFSLPCHHALNVVVGTVYPPGNQLVTRRYAGRGWVWWSFRRGTLTA
jgi:WD40 repeat protein